MITLDDVRAAADRVYPGVSRTPVAGSAALGRRLGTDVTLKLELFQKTGSFKPRGALNQLLAIPESERSHGVVGLSGGNFAQGLAYAARLLDVPATVVMPKATPANYVAATRGYGAEIVFVPDIDAAFAEVERLQSTGLAGTHPFDNPAMMAGNGTLGLEIVEQVPDVTHLIVSVGGGGLMTGVVTAVKALRPDVKIWAVETEGADALSRSLITGESVRITPTSVAKTLGSPYAAADAITAAHTHLEDVIVVPDVKAVAAMRFLFERCKVAAEPAAACTLAAADRIAENLDPDGRLVLILCGGNISVSDLCALTTRFEDD